MAELNGNGIRFFPLYWRHDDCWDYQRSPTGPVYQHWGHCHFFMLGIDWSGSQDAFNGQQTWRFEIKDLWGPRSDDPNQNEPYRVVGTPKWYWHLQEIWRRVYIQRWDEHVDAGPVNLEDMSETQASGRKGVRWDASEKFKGPFTEGQDFSPMYLPFSRTLPIEYFTHEDRGVTQRQNYVRDKAKAMTDAWNAANPGDQRPWVEEKWNLDHGTGTPVGHPASVPSFPDELYIYPTMEYQKVTQLDWERMPGWAAQHDIDTENFGDGWANTIQVPFVNPTTQKYNSPFGGLPGVCQPPGQYFGTTPSGQPLVPDSKKLRHRVREDAPGDPPGYDLANEPFGLPAAKSNQLVTFHDPYSAGDGKWVQQCLGGIVQVKAEVTIEHRLGGRQQIWVHGTQILFDDKFAGTDQLARPA
jgi:hypothetical protein